VQRRHGAVEALDLRDAVGFGLLGFFGGLGTVLERFLDGLDNDVARF
jgi:hypothetical protein